MSGFKPSRRTILTVGGAMLLGSGGAYLLGIGQGPKTPDCERQPPVDLSAPRIGNPEASVNVSAYTDFSCPHCKEYALTVLPSIRSKYIQSGKINYSHYDFPLPVDKWSRPAASAARSIQRFFGDEAYFTYAKKLYENQDEYSYELFGELATDLDITGKKVSEAARKELYCKELNSNIQKGLKRGVEGTPTVFVNKKKLTAPSASELADAIDEARQPSSEMTSAN